MNPSWTATNLKSSIMTSVVTMPSYSGICVTGGRLNAINSIGSAVRSRPDADRDGDSFSNLFEYLAGTRMDESTSRPSIFLISESGHLRLRMPRVPRPDGHLEVQSSVNLESWSLDKVDDFSTPNLLDAGIPVVGRRGFLRIRALPEP
ncbi:MAG: hypothetical protein ABR589_08670 [Chthoniobacterales bacterium]